LVKPRQSSSVYEYAPHLHEPGPGALVYLGCNGRGVALATAMGQQLAKRLIGGETARIDMPITAVNQTDLFADNVVPISEVVGRVPELYAWLTFSAERNGTLKHLCWAMPPADNGSWLAHINVLRRAEQAVVVDEIPAEEPAKIIKLRFRDHIEEVLSKQDESDNEKES
jgi:hypothetical protein